MDVSEVMTKIWDGTKKEEEQYWAGGSETWDKIKEEWVKTEVDKWIYETIDLARVQDEKFVKQIWDIYSSMTPRQLIEDIDTFVLL